MASETLKVHGSAAMVFDVLIEHGVGLVPDFIGIQLPSEPLVVGRGGTIELPRAGTTTWVVTSIDPDGMSYQVALLSRLGPTEFTSTVRATGEEAAEIVLSAPLNFFLAAIAKGLIFTWGHKFVRAVEAALRPHEAD